MPDHSVMVKRQKVLGEFGEFALRNEDLGEVMHRACELVGEALVTNMSKIVEIDHEKQELVVKAGVGWPPGVIGHKRLPMGERSSETYVIEQGEPVVTQDINKEDRFDFPDIMKEVGTTTIVNLLIFLPGAEKRPMGCSKWTAARRVTSTRRTKSSSGPTRPSWDL